MQKVLKINKKYVNYMEIITKCAINKNKNSYNTSDKIDKFMLNKFTFVLFFFSCIFLIFYLTFGYFGSLITDIFNNIFYKIIDKMRFIIYCINISNIFKSFISDVIFDSVLSIVSFIPQIVMLMFLFNLIEDTGLMSRFAFMLNGFMKKIGLTGKSLLSLFMGYGCSTSALLTTKNLENVKLRKRTALMIPFVSCSAKLPVFLVVASLFFSKYKYLFIFGLYLLSLSIGIFIEWILSKITEQNSNIFIFEMPKYRLPNLKKILNDMFLVVKDFVLKIGTIILFFGSIVWLTRNFTIDFKFLNNNNFEKSILFYISRLLLPIFSFIGLNNAGVVACLLLGLVAKEMVVVGFSLINNVSVNELAVSLVSIDSICYFTPTTSIIFLVFVLLYSPCISALATLKNEFGGKFMLKSFAFQFLVAYLVCFIFYLLMENLVIRNVFIIVLVLALFVSFVLKFSRKQNKCKGNCYECKKI